MNSTQSIPSVDLADFLSGDLNRKTFFVKALGQEVEDGDPIGKEYPISSKRAGEYLHERLREIGLAK